MSEMLTDRQVLSRALPSLLKLSHFSRVRLSNPKHGSPPGASVYGILQARILEWVAISFSILLEGVM